MVRITHGVLFFCIGKNTLYGLVPHGIEFLASFGFSQLFDQIEIFLPDMSCEYPLSAFICATNSSAGAVFAAFGRTAVSPFPFFACGRMPQFMSSGTFFAIQGVLYPASIVTNLTSENFSVTWSYTASHATLFINTTGSAPGRPFYAQ